MLIHSPVKFSALCSGLVHVKMEGRLKWMTFKTSLQSVWDAIENQVLLHCRLGKRSCADLHLSISPRGSTVFSKVRGSSGNLLYHAFWEREDTFLFLTHILILHNWRPLNIPLGRLLFREQPTKCKQVSDIKSELNLQVKTGTLAYSCPWAWQEIYFAVAEK